MNQRDLKKLRKERDAAREEFNRIDELLRKECKCPDSFMRTQVGYSTDTLGNNGTSDYQDFCTVCGKYHKSYGGVYGHYKGRENYPVAQTKDFL